jgi:hypothetical protein
MESRLDLPVAGGLPLDRLGLAQWLLDPRHPDRARGDEPVLAANLRRRARETAEESEPRATPSHPELLDWLATEFIRSGWNIKAMQNSRPVGHLPTGLRGFEGILNAIRKTACWGAAPGSASKRRGSGTSR